MTEGFVGDGVGVVRFPDGTVVRGRGRREPVPGGPAPTYALHLGRAHELADPWPCHWIDWPDFRVPRDFDKAVASITETFEQARAGERVEVSCGGGVGRTGTVIASMATLAGVEPTEAVAWTRANYRKRAVETPWQRRWVLRFAAATSTAG